jgi:protein-tyrosine phosphatase
MKEMGLNDENVENTNMAFISIIGTEECLKYWVKEDDKHYFQDHPNVLNLEFDDIEDDVMYNGHHFKTITMEQAEKTVNFIEKFVNGGIDIVYCHCKAGFSRSRGFCEFIYRYCRENDIEVEYDDRNDYTTMLNSGVLRRLNHAYWKKHNMRFYEDGKTEYPKDLIETPIRYIDRN